MVTGGEAATDLGGPGTHVLEIVEPVERQVRAREPPVARQAVPVPGRRPPPGDG